MIVDEVLEVTTFSAIDIVPVDSEPITMAPGLFVLEAHFAPPDVAADFLMIAAAHGLVLESRPGPDIIPNCRRSRTLGIPIGADVCAHSCTVDRYKCLPFGFLTPCTVPVHVPPLAEMLAKKLGYVIQRSQATDFVDLWLDIHKDIGVVADTFFALQARRPHLFCDSVKAFSNLDSVGANWAEASRSLELCAPDYDEVWHDLGGWLRET